MPTATNKKRNGWQPATHFFLDALSGPPGPAANHCRSPRRNTALWLIIGRTSCVMLESLTHDVYGFWWEILHPQPIPRSAVPRSKRLFQRSVFFHRKTNHSVQFHSGCGVLVTTRRRSASRSSRLMTCSRAKKKGPLHAKRPREIIRCESGMRCPPLQSRLQLQEISGCKPERPRHRPPQDPTRHRITSSLLLLPLRSSHCSHVLKSPRDFSCLRRCRPGATAFSPQMPTICGSSISSCMSFVGNALASRHWQGNAVANFRFLRGDISC